MNVEGLMHQQVMWSGMKGIVKGGFLSKSGVPMLIVETAHGDLRHWVMEDCKR